MHRRSAPFALVNEGNFALPSLDAISIADIFRERYYPKHIFLIHVLEISYIFWEGLRYTDFSCFRKIHPQTLFFPSYTTMGVSVSRAFPVFVHILYHSFIRTIWPPYRADIRTISKNIFREKNSPFFPSHNGGHPPRKKPRRHKASELLGKCITAR